MRLKSFLRPNQIVWVSPTNDTLLTGIYAEDYVAAARANGRPTMDFCVHEMHPFLRVDHGADYIGHRTGQGLTWVWCTGHHRFRFGDICLAQIPDQFALDDVHICQPPVKGIMISMDCILHDEGAVFVDNNDGITFGDIRRAVRQFLNQGMDNPDLHLEPCKCTTNVTNHELNYFARWTTASSAGRAYDYRSISFYCTGILVMMALFHSFYAPSQDYVNIISSLRIWRLDQPKLRTQQRVDHH
jgi:hypothetical protein